MDYRQIDAHINREPSQLQKELNSARLRLCKEVNRLKKTYPLRRWIEDRANLVGKATINYNNYSLVIHYFGDVSVEDVIEHLAGPIHRRTGCFWRLNPASSIDLDSIHPIKFPDSKVELRISIYIYDSADCKVIPLTRKVTQEVTEWKMDCQATA